MGIYKTVCYKVDDMFVKVLARKKEREQVLNKVAAYRNNKQEQKLRRKA
ncbi:hypothetical protein ABER68_00785 [Paenibacillus alvei]